MTTRLTVVLPLGSCPSSTLLKLGILTVRLKASIAFLKNDKAELIKQRDELAKATSPHSAVNLKIVNRMVDCFGQSYLEVYRGNCHANRSAERTVQ